jgi:hypothetical protein
MSVDTRAHSSYNPEVKVTHGHSNVSCYVADTIVWKWTFRKHHVGGWLYSWGGTV